MEYTYPIRSMLDEGVMVAGQRLPTHVPQPLKGIWSQQLAPQR
jgi:hypothetical protein